MKPPFAPPPLGPLLQLRRSGRALGRALLGLLYPPTCLGCGGRAPDRAWLCPACLRALPRAEPNALADRLARFPEARFGHAAALWVFDEAGALQQIQHALKYRNRPGFGVALGRLVGEAWRGADAPEPDLVVPVPLHRRRRLERGYNQSERLAAGLAETLGVPVRTELLARPRPTRSQTALSRAERWKNVEHAFTTPDGTALADRRVLLVDDVFTTGATVVAAAAPLRSAGATVDLAVLACTRQ